MHGDGAPVLELTARMAHDGKPVAGARLEFGFEWERNGLLVGDVTTDASGAAVYRRSFDDLALDVRMNGAFKDPWLVRWDSQAPVNGVAYCEAKATAPLPLAQLPQSSP